MFEVISTTNSVGFYTERGGGGGDPGISPPAPRILPFSNILYVKRGKMNGKGIR